MFEVAFFGTPHFSLPSLQALYDLPEIEVCAVVTQPDRKRGRGQKVQFSPIKELALEHGSRVLQPISIRKNEDAFLEELGEVDAFVVTAFGQILPEKTIHFPKIAPINVHGSILPRWRGAAPIQRAILAGDRETGICLMQMGVGLDDGPVYSDHRIAISEEDTTGTLHDRLSELGGVALRDKLVSILKGEIKAQEQSEEGLTYAKKIRPEEAELDWKKSAEELQNQVRGFAPRPGAFTKLSGKRLKILSAKPREEQLEPGLIDTSESMLIGCGSGSLELLEVQLEGKKAMSAADFMRGYQGSLSGQKLLSED